MDKQLDRESEMVIGGVCDDCIYCIAYQESQNQAYAQVLGGMVALAIPYALSTIIVVRLIQMFIRRRGAAS